MKRFISLAAAGLLALTVASPTLAATKKKTTKKATTTTTAATTIAPTTVAPTTAPAPAAKKKLKIAVIMPSAKNDLAFSQSMVDAMKAFEAQRGSLEIAYSDNLGNVTDAATAIRDYAGKGYDLVVAHGSQYGAVLKEVAPQYPKVSFAWGTSPDTFGLPNVYAYTAQADQGGFINGAMAALMTKSKFIGVIGPIEVGDAKLYIDGFKKGVTATNPDVKVEVNYIKSFGDVALAAAASRTFGAAGADVMTGTAQMVAGAIPVTEQVGAAWFGTQANQTGLSKKAVVASQVYRWEVILDDIVAGIEAGKLGGKTYNLTYANKGLSTEFNPNYKLNADVRAKGDATIKGITDGSIKSGI
jgi:basic membrane lipoprotein Med (substrate-binding protein (PBP1-ABC) superfamily)